LQDILDAVRQRGGGFTHRGKPLGLQALLKQLAVLNPQSGLQTNGGQQSQLIRCVGVVLHRTVDVDDPDDLIAAFFHQLAGLDRHAQRRANTHVVNASALAEALVGHCIARQHTFTIIHHVVDDGAGGVNLGLRWGFGAGGRLWLGGHCRFLPLDGGPVFIIARAHHLGNQFIVAFIEQQQNPAIGLHMLEHQVHHHFNNVIDIEAAAQRRTELIQQFQIGHGRNGRLRHRKHHRIFIRCDRVHDGAVHAHFFTGQADIPAGGPADAGLGTENHQRPTHPDLIAQLERFAVVNPNAIQITTH